MNGAPGLTRTGTPNGQQILNLSRLPIPPQGLRLKIRTIAMNVSGSIGVLGLCVPVMKIMIKIEAADKTG